jgi:septal ring factor EnvC (AmiA/AmiB activator)
MGSFTGTRVPGVMTQVIGVAALILTTALASPAFADVRAELAEKKAESAALTQKSKALGEETRALGTQMGTLKTRLVSTARSLRETEDKITETNAKLKALQADKAQCLDNLYKNQAAMGGLLAAAEKYSRTPTPDLLVQEKPLDAARASLIMKSMIPALNRQSQGLKDQINDMARIEGLISAELNEQSSHFKTLSTQQGDLSSLLKQRRDVYQKTEDTRRQEEAEVQKLAQQAKNLEELVAKIKPKVRVATGHFLPSNLPLPVSGNIRISFGDTDDYGSRSQGMTFSTRPGATIVTPLAGTVKFAGSFQKYKQILIVEHEGGYHSLIAGLGRIDTVVGATLSAGEPVGIAETSGGEARVYYELRQDGEPVNPRKLLLAQKKQARS